MALDSLRAKGAIGRIAGPLATILKAGILATIFCLCLSGTLMAGDENDSEPFLLPRLQIASVRFLLQYLHERPCYRYPQVKHITDHTAAHYTHKPTTSSTVVHQRLGLHLSLHQSIFTSL